MIGLGISCKTTFAGSTNILMKLYVNLQYKKLRNLSITPISIYSLPFQNNCFLFIIFLTFSDLEKLHFKTYFLISIILYYFPSIYTLAHGTYEHKAKPYLTKPLRQGTRQSTYHYDFFKKPIRGLVSQTSVSLNSLQYCYVFVFS